MPTYVIVIKDDSLLCQTLCYFHAIFHAFQIQMSGTIVQYILIRGDLLLKEAWPMGAVLAQACHAATAAIHLFYRNINHWKKTRYMKFKNFN